MSGQSLPPTEKRLRDARANGDVPRSELLIAWVVMAVCIEVGFAGLAAVGETSTKLFAAAVDRVGRPFRVPCPLRDGTHEPANPHVGSAPVRNGLRYREGAPHGPERLNASHPCGPTHNAAVATVQQLGTAALRSMLSVLAAIGAASCVAAIVGNWFCGGIPFAHRALAPSLRRLNPRARVKQLVSLRNLTTMAMAVGAATVIACTGFVWFAQHLPFVVALARWHVFESSVQSSVDSVHALLRIILAALIVPVAGSVVLARRQQRGQLRMSHREVRDEAKQTAGDPLVRQRQRAASVEALSLPPSHARPGHYAVVLNPDHLAVMLHYDGSEHAVPTVVACGAGASADRIAHEARMRGIATFRFRALARRLFERQQPGEVVPPDCYRAVAIVYRFVDEMQALTPPPTEPIEIDDLFFNA